MRGLRLGIVCPDVPFPANTGGRAEMWSRFLAWRSFGARLHLVFWSLSADDASVAATAMEARGIEHTALPRRRTLRSLWQRSVPPLAFSMRPISPWYERLRQRLDEFGPDLLVLEGWPGVLTGWRLASDLRRPLLYRSQNVEAQYWQEISRASTGVRRLRSRLTANRVGGVERAIRLNASLVLDISEDDAAEASRLGMKGRSRVLPPVWTPPASSETLSSAPRAEVDVVFGGSLWPPHHVEGVAWLLQSILPAVHRRLGRPVTARIVGARPTRQVRRLAAQVGVECRADVHDFGAEVARGAVLVNPVRRSSGINMKMLDFIASGRPVVTTRAGARGLSTSVLEQLIVADDTESFAEAVAAALRGSRRMAAPALRALVAREYGSLAQRSLLADPTLQSLDLPTAWLD